MKLYLLRHAHSDDGARDDPTRPLSGKGRQQCKTIRKFIKEADLKFDRVYCSDFARALQTAEQLRVKPTVTIALRPDALPEKTWMILTTAVEEDTKVFAITHHPLIEKLVADVCFAVSPDHEAFAHGSLIRIDTHEPEVIHRLRWIVTPNLANRLQEAQIWEALIRSTESLNRAEKAAIVNPMIARLYNAIAKRFRAQARAYRRHASIAVPPRVNREFRAVFNRETSRAYRSNAQMVQTALDGITEAAKRRLPGYEFHRSPEDLEEDLDTTTEERIANAEDPDTALATALGVAAILGRAKSSAEYEISRAFHAGGQDVVKEVVKEGRHVEKHWDTQDDPCELCQENEDAGWLSEDELYPNNPEGPPQHVNCTCSESFRIAGDGDEE